MRCETFERRLQALLDLREEPTHDELLTEHAQQCAGCRAQLEGDRLLRAVIARGESPSVGFTDRVLAAVGTGPGENDGGGAEQAAATIDLARPTGRSASKLGWLTIAGGALVLIALAMLIPWSLSGNGGQTAHTDNGSFVKPSSVAEGAISVAIGIPAKKEHPEVAVPKSPPEAEVVVQPNPQTVVDASEPGRAVAPSTQDESIDELLARLDAERAERLRQLLKRVDRVSVRFAPAKAKMPDSPGPEPLPAPGTDEDETVVVLAPPEWVDRAAGGLEPLTTTLGNTFSVFLETLPGNRHAEESTEPETTEPQARAFENQVEVVG